MEDSVQAAERQESTDGDEALESVDTQEHNAEIGSRNNSRPCYARDHCWLDWHLKEDLGPAKIRDRWDAMTEGKRRAISLAAREPVGGADRQAKKAGYEVVKAALRKAKKERKKERGL